MYCCNIIGRVARSTFISLVFVIAAYSATPALLFSDLDSGPISGGENNKGVYVCVSGKQFGATRGTSTIAVGGVPVTTYAYWGTSGVTGAATDKACFQMASTTPAGAQNIIMTVNGVASNPLPFTVRTQGKIYCVDSQNGNDSNNGRYRTEVPAGNGCKGTISAAYSLLSPGDTLYVHSGTYTTNTKGMTAVIFLNGSGTPGLPKAVSGYPGATVAVGTDLGNGVVTYGVRGAGDGYPCDYHTIANLHTVHGFAAAIGMNGCQNVRIIGNSFTCPLQTAWQGCAGASGLYNASPYVLKEASYQKWYGNDIYNDGTSVAASYVGHLIPGPYTITAGVNDKLDIAVNGGPDQIITLSPCSSCSSAVVAANLSSKLNGATASASGNAISLQSTAGGYDNSSLSIKAVANNAYALFGWTAGQIAHGGASKYTHSFYYGTNGHDLDFGWNVVRDNNSCRGVQLHSSPTGPGDANDPTGQSLYNVDIHHNLIYNVACDGLNFASVDPSLGPVRAYNNIVWNSGTGKNQTNEGGFSAVNIGQLHNKFYASADTACLWTSSGTAVTGNGSCHFTTDLQVGWSLTSSRFPDDASFGSSRNAPMTNVNQHLLYAATIDSIQDDQHLTLDYMPAPYNRVWISWTGNFTNQNLMWIKSGRGNLELYNNTFYSNGNTQAAYKTSASAYCRSGGAKMLVGKLVNNIIYQTGSLSYACTAQVVTGDANSYSFGDHNLFFTSGTAQPIPSFATNNITRDPLFSSLALPDFHVGSTSPVVDAGLSNTVAVRDFDGLLRPQGAGFDLGALELPGSGVTLTPSANLCDLNTDGVVDKADVVVAINQAIGVAPCGNSSGLGGTACNVTAVQRVINATQGLGCILP